MDTDNCNILDNRFWLPFLKTNIQYILYSLSYIQTKEIEEAQALINRLEILYQRTLTGEGLMQIDQDAYKTIQDLRRFILHILKGKMDNSIIIYLLPAQLNNMVNRTEEYLNLLAAYTQNKIPDIMPIDINIAWLMDAYTQAEIIANNVDFTFKDVQTKSLHFADAINALFMRAILLKGIMRTGLTHFPAIEQLSTETADQMHSFYQFIEELRALTLENKIFGTIYPVLLEQIQRETCYYHTKLSQASSLPTPDCDPYNDKIKG